ncbi:MG2 domain-containing protein [Vogesella facilis]|uniref:MG2 domain-containing protein n=1 Tax=Vogesella facilis TaxID=1655232 RepID=A0ABV7RDA6_9NEIS
MKTSALLLALAGVFHLAPALAAGVATFSPQGEVTRPSQVRLSFSSAMVRLGDSQAAAPVQWNCQLAARGHWVDDKSWVLDISAPPPANTRCQFTLRAGLKDLQGAALPAASYSFFTGAPSIVQSWPQDGERIEEEQAFVLKLNARAGSLPGLSCQSSALAEQLPLQPLPAAERGVLLRHLKLEQDAASILTVRCGQRLAPDSKLTLHNPRQGGEAQRLDYRVRPPFRATLSCSRDNARGACIPFKPISLAFSSPVLPAQAAAIRLHGADGERQPLLERNHGEALDSISFAPPFTPQQALQLTLPRGFSDEVGRTLQNADKFPLPVRIGAFPPLAKFAAAPFGIIEAAEDASLPVTLRGVEAALPLRGLQLSGMGVVAREDRNMMRWLGKVLRYHESRISVAKGRELESRRLSLLRRRPDARRLALPEQPDSKGRWPFQVVGIPLPQRGLHVVEIESRLLGKALLGANAPMYVRTAALVTNLAVHFKRSPENAAVWVTTLDRAQPVAGAQVRIYDCREQLLWQGNTDKQGVARVDKALQDASCSGEESLEGLFITARARDSKGVEDVSFVRSGWNRGIEAWRFPFPTNTEGEPAIIAHSILDRSLLRAGETVSMKHLLRIQNSKGLAMLKAGELPEVARIRHDGSDDELVLPLNWRKGRYAESSLALPKAAKLGEYSIYLERKGVRGSRDYGQPASPALDGYSLYSGGFRVEEFRLPVMSGRISYPAGAGVPGSPLPLKVNLAWGNGGAARNWPLQVSAMLQARYESPRGYQDFSFNPPRRDGEQDGDPLDGKLLLDKAPLQLDGNGNGKISVDKLPALDRPYWLQAEASLRDPSGETQTISRMIPLWPSALQVGVQVEDWVSVGRKLGIKAVVLDTQGRPQAGRNITLLQLRREYLSSRKRLVGGFYAWEHEETRSDERTLCKGKSDARGMLFCELAPEQAGSLEVIARVEDDKGNPATASQDVWVSGQDEVWFDVDDHDRIDVLPERSSYNPGDIARFQVRMPFRKATAWVAIEREGIVETRVLELSGKQPVIELEVRPEWGPNVYVSVLAVRGRVRDVPWYSFFTWGWKTPLEWWSAYWNEGSDYSPPSSMVDLSRPAFKYGVAEIEVGDKARRLQVTVTPQRKQYGIREQVQVRIQVRMPDGKPAPAGTELAFAAVDDALLRLQPNNSWKLMEAMYQRHSYGVETATAQLEVVGKRHYGRKALPPGGGGGRAPTRELLDTLLLWQPAVVLDANGAANLSVPLNDALTRFRLVAVADVGDNYFGSGEAEVDVVQEVQISNGLPPLVREGDQLAATVTVRNGSARAMTLEVGADWGGGKLPAQRISLPAGEAREVSWPFTVPQDVRELAWTIRAQEPGGKGGDTLAFRQQVEPAVAVTVEQATLLRLDAPRSLPLALPPGALAGKGGVRVSLQSRLGSELPAVRRWFADYPYACLEQRSSKALGLASSEQWARTMAELPLYLDGDGLADYFPLAEGDRGSGSDVLTSYLLQVSQEAGQTIPDGPRQRMLDGLAAFVEGRLARELPISRQDRDARRLGAMLALARHGRFQPAMLDVLDLQLQRWSTAMLVDWLELLQRVPAIPARAERLAQASQLLRSRLSYQGTRLVFSGEEADGAWWLMGSADLNAARLLLVASRLPDWQADVPRLLSGLLARQQRGHWQTTTANLWGQLAVAQFSRQYENVAVSGSSSAELADKRVTATATATAAAMPLLPWPVAGRGTLQLTHQGSGAPWATVQLEAAVKFSGQRYAGYSVKKTLTAVSQQQAGEYRTGDVLKVTLDINAQADMSWVVVDDPIPAGASILGSGLGNDSAIAVAQADERGDGWPDFVERRFAGYRAYYRFVPRGNLKVEYTVRLNNPGQFQLPATRVEAMYAPGVFGMLANAPFRVARAQ